MAYVLGIDLGTGSLKGSLFYKEGTLVASASSKYSIINTHKGYSEQNPNDWVEALEDVINQLSIEVKDFTEKLEAISLSGQMHSLVLLDENMNILRDAILWNDVRTTDQCNKIMEEFGDSILKITKNIALEGFTLPKILWVQENEPELWNKVSKILLPKDYLGLYLTGKVYTDYSDAAGTLLLDIESKNWSKEICEKFSIPLGYLPKLYESTQCVGSLRPEIIDKFGFKNKVQFFAGGADNACGAIGAGIVNRDKAMVSIGTSGVFLSIEDNIDKEHNGKLHYFNHAMKDKHYSMGVTLAAGYSLDWFKNTFAAELNYNELLTGIEDIEAGSNGLLFAPYITGERTPYFDSKIRGSFIGIDANHTFKHFVKALIEGVTFSLKESQGLLTKYANTEIKNIVSIGGGANNKEWLQIQADIFNSNILTLKVDQGPGLGAAMIAAVGIGWYENFEDCSKAFIRYNERVKPIQNNVKIYKKIYDSYKKIYPSTSELIHSL